MDRAEKKRLRREYMARDQVDRSSLLATRVPWFFVRRLYRKERPREALEFEIQVLNEDGTTRESFYCARDGAVAFNAAGEEVPDIPETVVRAAQGRDYSDGEYVGTTGKPMSPFLPPHF